jgi:hypothetical protein
MVFFQYQIFCIIFRPVYENYAQNCGNKAPNPLEGENQTQPIMKNPTGFIIP